MALPLDGHGCECEYQGENTVPQPKVLLVLRLFYTSFVFAFLGAASGLYYRELTKAYDLFDRSATQLPLVHTHFLVLGFIALLIVLALERLLHLTSAAPRLAGWFYWVWTSGVGLTGGMMLVKGTIAVGGADASSPALAGVAGLGHMLLTAGLVLLFFLLRAGIARAAAGDTREVSRG